MRLFQLITSFTPRRPEMIAKDKGFWILNSSLILKNNSLKNETTHIYLFKSS